MSESPSNNVSQPTETDPPRPTLLLVACLCGSQAIAGAFGGWEGDSVVSWPAFLICIGLGVVILSGYQLVAWCRNPGRYEDGSLHFRSLQAVVISVGILGGALWGLLLWGLAWFVWNVLSRIALAEADVAIRAGVGAIIGGGIGALVAWYMLRRR